MPADRWSHLSRLAEAVLGPVCVWEAVRTGRRPLTLLVRLGYTVAVVGLLGLVAYTMVQDATRYGRLALDHRALAALGTRFFEAFVVIQFCAVVGLTPVYTAGAITDEKERKTLHFLLATGLTGREVVLGKVAARTGVVLLFVLAGLPVLAMLQLFGGIEPRLLAAATAGTVATVVGVAAAGAVASVVLSRTRDAVLATYVIGVGYLFASSWLVAVADYSSRQGSDVSVTLLGRTVTGLDVATAVAAGNPFVFVNRVYVSGGSGAYDDVWAAAAWYVGFYLLGGAAGLAAASAALRPLAARAGGGPVGRWKWWNWLLGRRSTARPHPPVSDDPVRWKEVHTGTVRGLRRFIGWAVVGGVGLSFAAVVWDSLVYPELAAASRYRGSWKMFTESTKVWVTAWTVALGLLALFGTVVHGACGLTGEREQDTWVSLLTTPLTAEEIARGKWWGAVLAHRRTYWLVGGVWAVGVLTGSVNPLCLVPVAGFFVLYVAAFGWLGVLCSAAARGTVGALVRAVPVAGVLAGGFWFLLGCCCVPVLSGLGRGPEEFFKLVMIVLCELTPPVMLGGLVYSDDILREFGGRPYSSDRESTMGYMVIGLVVSVLAWLALWRVLKASCEDWVRQLTNRTDSSGFGVAVGAAPGGDRGPPRGVTPTGN